MVLSPSERTMLGLLAQEEFKPYAECYGRTLGALITKDLVRLHLDGVQRVSVTAAGRKAIDGHA